MTVSERRQQDGRQRRLRQCGAALANLASTTTIGCSQGATAWPQGKNYHLYHQKWRYKRGLAAKSAYLQLSPIK
ncbi:hypothetical protein [Massilia sp. DWR3-1-1]|uniref:hypothetical protein n=1 Tax=Massilia sp. DWR3-1-1 TaxID=2804559 RepID=UPI003CF0D907